MRARSKKRAAQERVYARRRLVFLEANPDCGAGPEKLPRAGCTGRSEQVHHMAGRVGDLLLDEGRWLALCARCHGWATDHPAEAYEAGVSVRRGRVTA